MDVERERENTLKVHTLLGTDRGMTIIGWTDREIMNERTSVLPMRRCQHMHKIDLFTDKRFSITDASSN